MLRTDSITAAGGVGTDMCMACSLRVGLAMLSLQGASFVLFLLGAVLMLHETLTNLSLWRKWLPTPADKFADAVRLVMMRVQPPACLMLNRLVASHLPMALRLQ